MKKLIVLLFVLLPMGAFAQGKIAFVDFNEVFDLMPERTEAENKLAAVNAQYQDQYKAMTTELNAKYEEFMKIQETLTENIKVRKQGELQELQDRIQNFVPQAQQEIQQEEMKLLTPIQEKVTNAIKVVATEQGYDYTFDSRVLFHTGNNAIDATPLVKAKLGIK